MITVKELIERIVESGEVVFDEKARLRLAQPFIQLFLGPLDLSQRIHYGIQVAEVRHFTSTGTDEWWLILDDHLLRVAAKFTGARKTTVAVDAEHYIYPLREIGFVELKTKYEGDGAGRSVYLRSAHLTFAASPTHNLSVSAEHPPDGTLVPEAIVLFTQQLMTRTSGTAVQAVREASWPERG